MAGWSSFLPRHVSSFFFSNFTHARKNSNASTNRKGSGNRLDTNSSNQVNRVSFNDKHVRLLRCAIGIGVGAGVGSNLSVYSTKSLRHYHCCDRDNSNSSTRHSQSKNSRTGCHNNSGIAFAASNNNKNYSNEEEEEDEQDDDEDDLDDEDFDDYDEEEIRALASSRQDDDEGEGEDESGQKNTNEIISDEELYSTKKKVKKKKEKKVNPFEEEKVYENWEKKMMTQSILPGEEWMRPDGNERSKTADYVPYEVMRSMIPYKWKTWFNVLTGRTETLFNKEGNLINRYDPESGLRNENISTNETYVSAKKKSDASHLKYLDRKMNHDKYLKLKNKNKKNSKIDEKEEGQFYKYNRVKNIDIRKLEKWNARNDRSYSEHIIPTSDAFDGNDGMSKKRKQQDETNHKEYSLEKLERHWYRDKELRKIIQNPRLKKVFLDTLREKKRKAEAEGKLVNESTNPNKPIFADIVNIDESVVDDVSSIDPYDGRLKGMLTKDDQPFDYKIQIPKVSLLRNSQKSTREDKNSKEKKRRYLSPAEIRFAIDSALEKSWDKSLGAVLGKEQGNLISLKLYVISLLHETFTSILE